MHTHKQILSCDWGTSSFRLRIVNVNSGFIEDEIVSNKGIASVYDDWQQQGKNENSRIDFYKTTLQSFIQLLKKDIDGLPLIISGMASSTLGMQNMDYATIPFDLLSGILNTSIIKADEICPHNILLVSGLKTANDAMRGEETMLLGCNFKNDEDVLAIFPGTHSKHVFVKSNVIVDCKTYMTGEVFELLATKSVLSKSVIKNNKKYDTAFENGVKEGFENNILNSIFHARTNQLFSKNSAEENYHYLSGLLIGTELKEITNIDANIYLVCNKNIAQQYTYALKLTGNKAKVYDADKALINGHCKLSNFSN